MKTYELKTQEYTNADGFKYITIRGISELVSGETRAIYGVFERVNGGVQYSNEDSDSFDTEMTDDIIYLKRMNNIS